MKKIIITILCCSASMTWANSDLDMENKIRAEGFYNSEVMHTLEQLTDEIGPRLSGSSQMIKANEWTLNKLKKCLS
jgi:carboxypeptidase Q